MTIAEASILTVGCGGLLFSMTARGLWEERAARKRMRERWDEAPDGRGDESDER